MSKLLRPWYEPIPLAPATKERPCVSLPHCVFFGRRGHNLPTPPKGRATIRLWRTQSLEQKLPLEVSLMSLAVTCQEGQNFINPHVPAKGCSRDRFCVCVLSFGYLAVAGIGVHTQRLLLLVNKCDCII